MAKTYKILVNDGKGTDIKPVSVMQGASAKGEPVRMTAKRGWRFELQDDLKGKNLGPDQVRLKRMGKNLGLMFDGSVNPDVIIEDFYAENEDKEKDNGSPMIVGQAEDGGMYEYVPQDPAASSMASQLKDGNTPVIVALGGGPLAADFALAGLPLIAAAGGGIGGLLAGGAALVAAAAAGGGGGGGSAGAVPSGQTGHITHDAANDTGVSTSDSYTMNNKPQLTVNAESGATVVVSVNGKDYPATETSTKGVYTAKVADVLPDGVYTPVIKVTNGSGSSTANGEAFTVDTSTTKNQDNKKTPTETDDSNSGASVEVNIVTVDDGTTGEDTTIVSRDTGSSKIDFITSDGTLIFKGEVKNFNSTNGDVVHVQVYDQAGNIVNGLDKYVTPVSGVWTIPVTETGTLVVGEYTIKAFIEDKAGNVVKSDVQPLTIALENQLTARDDELKVTENENLGKSQITAANGVLANDGDTSAKEISVKSVNGSTANVGVVVDGKYGQLELFADGHFNYTQDSRVNKLAEGKTDDDIFTYVVKANGSSPERTATAELKIHITGKNDPAEMTLDPENILVKINGSTLFENESSAVTITDDDQDDTAILGVLRSGNTVADGSLGTIKIIGNNDDSYGFSYSKYSGKDPLKPSPSVPGNTNKHDLFSLTSKDGTENKTLDFVLAGDTNNINGAEIQEFNLAPLSGQNLVKGLTLNGLTTATDTLILHGSATTGQQTTFDFSNIENSSFTSIEKIDIQGAGENIVYLSLANLTQADSLGSIGQQLFVSGDSGDKVYFKSAVSAVDNGLKTINGLEFHSYNFATDELLVQTAISSITFTS